MISQEAKADIGNHVKVWYQSMGTGSPAILLEGPGPNCDSEPWMEIQRQLAAQARTCRYDRAGTGKSTGSELSPFAIPPRTRDLENLLEVAFIEPPYVMVGYSLGGAIVLRYALQHVDRMAGLVLVESAIESMMSRIDPEMMPPDTSQLHPLGDLPLVVITIDTDQYAMPPLPNASPELALQIWLKEQAELATLSSRGRQVFVRNTNHFSISETHAAEVIHAVETVLQEAR